jgi:Protein of unknown function (DUF2939)
LIVRRYRHHCDRSSGLGELSQMRKLALVVVGLPLACAGYAVWPMASALQIKHAVKSGDVTTLERLVDWQPVRASLKASLANMPAMQIAGDERRLMPGQAMPSIWARIKAAAAPILLERMIDSYVTAEGVTQLHQIKSAGLLSALGVAPQPAPQVGPADNGGRTNNPFENNLVSRMLSFYERLICARFHSLSLAEFEIADTANTGHRIVSQFALSNFEWKLVSVRIIGAS